MRLRGCMTGRVVRAAQKVVCVGGDESGRGRRYVERKLRLNKGAEREREFLQNAMHAWFKRDPRSVADFIYCLHLRLPLTRTLMSMCADCTLCSTVRTVLAFTCDGEESGLRRKAGERWGGECGIEESGVRE